jgi:hypothetical protein
MVLADPDFPASAAFDAIQAGINENPKDKADAVKKANSIFGFTLKNKAGKTASWHVDLKDKGEVAKGEAPEGKKADGKLMCFQCAGVSVYLWLTHALVTLTLADEDFGKLVTGTAKAQSLFMSGKLKIKGDIMKATRLEPILGTVQKKAKL